MGPAWREQIEHYFDIRTAVLPWCVSDEKIARLIAAEGGFAKAFPHAAAVRELAAAIPKEERPGYPQNPDGYPQKSAGSWQAKVDLSARLMQAQRGIRHVPPSTSAGSPDEEFPPKCSLFGSYEQMGPANLQNSGKFWEQVAAKCKVPGVRLREGKRLCAVALVKRFAGPCFFAGELHLKSDDLRYEDTATVAAAEWLNKDEHAKLKAYSVQQHGSQWLHSSSPTQGQKDGEAEIPDEVWNALLDATATARPPTTPCLRWTATRWASGCVATSPRKYGRSSIPSWESTTS